MVRLARRALRGLVVVLSAMLIAGLTAVPALAVDTNPADFTYSQTLTVSNPNSSALTDFQVKVSLNSSNFDFADAQSAGQDLRFYASDGETPLNFWIANYSSSAQTATIWVEVPSIPADGSTTIVMRYGNPTATTASDGFTTFPFFDDFSDPSPNSDYFTLSAPQTEMVQDQSYETSAPHTMSVLPLNLNGYEYYSYYGPQSDGWIGLAASNNLTSWTKLGEVQDLSGTWADTQARWPSAIIVGSTIYVAMEQNYTTLPSYIGLYETSVTDPSQLTLVETLIAPQGGGPYDQNPFLWYDPNNDQFYIYWYSSSLGGWSILARTASSVPALADASNIEVLNSASTLAAPNMMYLNGTYYLGTEIEPASTWETEFFSSTSSPVSGFEPMADAPELPNGDACPSQNVVGSTLYLYSCEQASDGVWSIVLRTANLSVTPATVTTPNDSLWTPSGGSNWQVVDTTQPNGSDGPVAEGTTSTPFQILQSTYTTGSDYVLDAYGQQVSGRVWGLGVGVTDPEDLDSINLYDDLNGSDNLYLYKWTSANGTQASTIADAAVGTVNANQWYELTAKVDGSAIAVYLNGQLEVQGSDPALTPGNIALYGEGGTEEFSDVFVRQYAATDPTVTVASSTLLSQSISFTSSAPTDATVGGPTYTVAATGGGSGNPVTFTIDSSATAVCSISGSVVSFTGPGTCTIDANQAGNSTYSAAPEAQQSFTVSSTTTGFAYSQDLTVSNPNSSALTNFQVKVSLTSSNFDFAEAQSAGQDLRFYASDGETPLNFWIASYSSSAQTATIWVEVPSIPADGSATIVMKWGNTTATTASDGPATFPFFDNFSEGDISSSTWTASGGTWQVVDTTEPNGSDGPVAEGTTSTPFQILQSTYTTGSDYVLDAYGQQVSGRVWGLGVGVTNAKDLDSINLYDDLNGSDNLYLYKWTSASATNAATIADAAVGTVNASQWYELTAKVDGSAIAVYLNGQLEVQGTDSALTAGNIALYGEGGTEEFSDVFVRQYAATDPTVTFSSSTLLPQTITFTSSPTSPTVGGPTYTVTANGGGSGNPVTFTIDSSATSVCSISGSVVSFIAAGTCTIDANQAGNSTYSAAPEAQQSFTVAPETTGSNTVTPSNPGAQSSTSGIAITPLTLTATDSSLTATVTTWSATGLPPGLSIAGTTTGKVTGTPTTAGTYTVKVTATDSTGSSGSTSFTWTVTNTVTVTAPASQTSTSGTAIAGLALSATDSSSVATIASWSATGLPPGLGIAGTTTGEVTGTPTTAGTYTVKVTATDSAGFSGSTSFTWTVTNTVTVTTPASQTSTSGTAIAGLTLSAKDSSSVATIASWSATGLPPGLTIGTTTGEITGTPTTAGTYTVEVTATDSASFSGSTSFTWTVTNTVTVTKPASQSSTVGTAIAGLTLSAKDSSTTATIASWSASGLPPGLAINTTTGQITGTPTTRGRYSVTATAKDSAGFTGSTTFSWRVVA